jgi:spore photoproduct lyase
VRIRVDPMVPIEGWEEAYQELIDDIFNALEPERITFGSLRGLQSTINEAWDKSWVKYLTEKTEWGEGERTEWGRKIPFELRFKMYKWLVDYVRKEKKYKGFLAMCKETLGMWVKMGWDYRECRCNCVW